MTIYGVLEYWQDSREGGGDWKLRGWSGNSYYFVGFVGLSWVKFYSGGQKAPIVGVYLHTLIGTAFDFQSVGAPFSSIELREGQD